MLVIALLATGVVISDLNQTREKIMFIRKSIVNVWKEYKRSNCKGRKEIFNIARQYAESFNMFNDNHPTANPRYYCTAVNGNYSGILFAQVYSI